MRVMAMNFLRKVRNMNQPGKAGKRKPSKIEMTYQTQPQDANPAGNVHGGVIMKLIDTAAGVAAARHARCNCVTASMDRMDFHQPVFVGDLVTIKVSVNYVSKSSMEVGARVEAEDLLSGQVRHTSSAYLTFVALDEAGCPTSVPELAPISKEDKRRHAEGKLRQAARKKLRQKSSKVSCASGK